MWVMDIRDRIRSRLKDLAISQRRASLEAGLSETALRKFLIGEVQSMSSDNMDAVARILKVSPTWLRYGISAEIIDIWERIPEGNRPQAEAVLRALAGEN